MAETTEQWAVMQAEVYPGEGCASGMWTGFTIFDTLEEAVARVEDIIRNEWTSTIGTDKDNKDIMLADHRGYCWPEGSVKWSEVYYAEDGTEAWQELGDQVKYIKVKKVEPKGERNSSC